MPTSTRWRRIWDRVLLVVTGLAIFFAMAWFLDATGIAGERPNLARPGLVFLAGISLYRLRQDLRGSRARDASRRD